MLKFHVKQSGGPPPGIYRASFQTVEDTEHEEYGAGLKFDFLIEEGDCAGQHASRITSDQPTPKNAAGRMLAGITGAAITAETDVDLQPFVGRLYLIQVEETKNGGSTRIASAMPTWKE
ncbi:MAG: hypothetical protein L6306_17265 [Planctomycetales bacterium]|nr:hypothetical protein [Planctomycetales bacterium]